MWRRPVACCLFWVVVRSFWVVVDECWLLTFSLVFCVEWSHIDLLCLSHWYWQSRYSYRTYCMQWMHSIRTSSCWDSADLRAVLGLLCLDQHPFSQGFPQLQFWWFQACLAISQILHSQSSVWLVEGQRWMVSLQLLWSGVRRESAPPLLC